MSREEQNKVKFEIAFVMVTLLTKADQTQIDRDNHQALTIILKQLDELWK